MRTPRRARVPARRRSSLRRRVRAGRLIHVGVRVVIDVFVCVCVCLFVSSSLKNACDHQTIRRRIFSLWFGNVPNSFTSSCDDVCWHFFVMSSYAALRTFQFLCSTRCSNGNRAALDSSSASSDIIAGPLGIAEQRKEQTPQEKKVLPAK